MLNTTNAPLWISAGEPSGDIHGAALLAALQEAMPGRRFIGMGGPAMRAQGFEALHKIEELSVMGITEVLSSLPRILHLLNDISLSLELHKPSAIIVIDAPDFHFRVIKAATALGIPVYYYISPKVWAWRSGRATFIKQHVKRLISILPFEEDFYKDFGLAVDYVGNPLVDMLNLPDMDKIAAVPGHVGLLPGSRKSEVKALLPCFAKAAALMRAEQPNLEFCCMRAPGMSEDFLRSFWKVDAPLRMVEPEDRYIEMRRCSLLLASSGTATLECALLGIPTLVAYKVSFLSAMVGRLFIKVPYVSLPNLIAGRELFPEFLQRDCTGEKLAAKALQWLDPQSRTTSDLQAGLAELRVKVGGPGAARRAAALLASDLL